MDDSDASLRQLERSIATFRTRIPGWDAFADARVAWKNNATSI